MVNTKNKINVVGLMALLYASVALSKDSLIIGIAENAPPKEAIKAVLQQAYKNIGVSAQFKELPGRRSVVYANEGHTDAEAFRVFGIDKKYPNLIRVDVPIRSDDMYLYVKQGKEFDVEGWESVPKEYVVGFRRGLLTAEYAVKKHGLIYSEINNIESIGLHLESGRSDTVILGAGGSSLFEELGSLDIVRLEPPIITSTLYHYVHINNQHLVAPLTQALKEMQKSGEIKQINDRVSVLESDAR